MIEHRIALAPKHQPLFTLINPHRVPLAEPTLQNLQSQRIFNIPLNSPFQGQDTVAGVIEQVSAWPPRAAKYGVDFVLSGHMHGGQIWPFKYLAYLQQPYIQGFYQYKKTLLYVNQGTGYWGPPMRVGTYKEITEFVLDTDREESININPLFASKSCNSLHETMIFCSRIFFLHPA